MGWNYFLLSDKNKIELKNFISSIEFRCITFAAYLKKLLQDTASFSGKPKICESIVIHRDNKDVIDFALMITPVRQLLLSGRDLGGKIVKLKDGLELFGRHIIKTGVIMGEENAVTSILPFFWRNSNSSYIELHSHTLNYYTMTLVPEKFTTIEKSDSRKTETIIKKCKLEDFKKLIPLQKNYEIEEVLLSPSMFTPAASKQNLLDILSRQLTFAAEISKTGEIIAKANTNESGFYYKQIGGVYTVPKYRNSGVATALVRTLCESIISNNFIPSLFVKKENIAAIRVYEKLGFEIKNNFQITYLT